MSRSFSLSIKDLHQLTGTLSDVYFDKTKWFDLGLSLHLPETELKAIKDDCSSDSHKCLRECLCLWLKSAGSPQAQVLANALDDISIKPAAERINKIFCSPSSQYLMSCSDELCAVAFDDNIVSLMCTEGLIDEKKREEIANKGNMLSDGIIRAICLKLVEDPSKLKALAEILLKSKMTESVGRRLLSNFNENLKETQELPNENAKSEKVFVNEAHEEMFETMRGAFGKFKTEISLTIAKAKQPMKGQKEFLKCCFPELGPELSSAKTTKKIVNILLKKCTIINVAVIKTYVEKYNIKSGINLVNEYQEKVEEFCSKAEVELALNKNLSPDTSSLRCEEIEIILDWEPSEHSLKDIKLLLKKVFSYLNARVIVKTITEGSSIIITCYAPQYLMNELSLIAQANLSVLREEEKLIRLRFGYHTVFDETTKEKKIKYLDKDWEKSSDSHKITGKIESKHSRTEASRQLRQRKLIDESLKVALNRKAVDEIIKGRKDAMIQKSKHFLRKSQRRTRKDNRKTAETLTPILVH